MKLFCKRIFVFLAPTFIKKKFPKKKVDDNYLHDHEKK